MSDLYLKIGNTVFHNNNILDTKMDITNFDDLKFFLNYEDDVILDFLPITYDFLIHNVKNKAYASASQKLGTTPSTIENVISKLALLFLECAKLRIVENEFQSCLQEILPLSKLLILWEGYNNMREKLFTLLDNTGINHPHYSAINWRLECTLASRSLQKQKDVNIAMNLSLKKRDCNEHHNFTADIPNLIHITEVLEIALSQAKLSHIRKVQRSLK